MAAACCKLIKLQGGKLFFLFYAAFDTGMLFQLMTHIFFHLFSWHAEVCCNGVFESSHNIESERLDS